MTAAMIRLGIGPDGTLIGKIISALGGRTPAAPAAGPPEHLPEPLSQAETTQPREHWRRSRTTDTAELDAAAALVPLTSLVQSIYSRIAVRHDLTPVQAKLLCIVTDNPAGCVTLRSASASRRLRLNPVVFIPGG
jgi:hypothetical protein